MAETKWKADPMNSFKERIDPGRHSDERTMLIEFLEFHRATFRSKVVGLTTEQAKAQHPPTTLTLARLTKHLAYVETTWWHRVSGDPKPDPWSSAPFLDDPDWDLHSADDDEIATLIDLYDEAVHRGRQTLDSLATLDHESALPNRVAGDTFTVRWVLLHLIEETARHNGHADLLREAIDGSVGE